MKNTRVIQSNFFLLVIGFFCMSGCHPKELSLQEYVAYIENPENGLKVKKQVGDFVFELQYKPEEYLLAKENSQKELNSQQWHKELKELEGLQYFNLKIISANSGGEMLRTGIRNEYEYQKRIEYFSYAAQKDMRLIDGTDTLSCVLYHFERSYDLAPYSNVVLGFPEGKNKELHDKIISFDDKALGTGIINMKVDQKDIQAIPQIKIQ